MNEFMNNNLLITDSPSGNLILGDETLEEKKQKEDKYNKEKLED